VGETDKKCLKGRSRHTRSAPVDDQGWGPGCTWTQSSALDSAGCKTLHRAQSDQQSG